MSDPQDLKNFTEDALAAWLARYGAAPYRAGQILRWIYQKGAVSFSQMTDLSKDLRRCLSEQLVISNLDAERVQASKDGSRKYLFRLKDGHHVESVLIPQRDHWTLCISSQVGCPMACTFCLTGRMGWLRNLESSEIVNQVSAVRSDLPNSSALTNIVFMGMGEPLANYSSVIQAIRTLVGPNGLQFSGRRVTLSTSGLVPKLDDLGQAVTVNLAVSLNAADNETRNKLMPINRTYPIEMLLSACRRFPLPSRRMITFEYVLIAGMNDHPAHAERLAKLLRPIRAKINLIPFNPYEGCDFEKPSESAVLTFQKVLTDRHYTAIVRHSKGVDIGAACGQLGAQV